MVEGILQMPEDRLTHGIASDANLKLLLQAAAMNLPRADSDVLALKAAEDAQGHNTTQGQKNGFDCGVFVLSYAQWRLEGLPFLASDMKNRRHEWLCRLVNGTYILPLSRTHL
ncbi:hypothetical protein CEUSTIGMA_g5182.t1 [Chlamydomonas eustigma]|uniref:Uncharacterized protein n=1 Tax=Chlamydomonas eustigma TaxID=1157962 RepID=A0A250X492_9CHLO|nr:hypothetical protein CEUSTIGMA_g5182.t1 [Chlamydomonas eustigma]|eukprot:GAX77739.1 hypothetical protein CEUSTIGMA_g5182.t1 [Chlamydomonas eustigma]